MVKSAQLVTPGATYKALIVLPCKFMPLSTLETIRKIIKNGGKVIFLDHMPEDVPGLNNLRERRRRFNRLIHAITVQSPFPDHGSITYGKGKIAECTNINKTIASLDISKESMVNKGLAYVRRRISSKPSGGKYFIANTDTGKYLIL